MLLPKTIFEGFIMSSRYRKIHCLIWNDDKFPFISDYGKLVFFHLLTTPFSTPFGCFKAGKAALLEESRIDSKGFEKGFAEGLSKGLFKYDDKTLTIFLPNFLKHNRPDNPNVVKKWAKIFAELPDGHLKAECYHAISACCEGLGEGFAKGFMEGFGEPPRKSIAIQEQEQEQEIYVPKGTLSGSTTRQHAVGNKIPFQEIISHLNEKSHSNFKADSKQTKSHITARFNEGFTLEDFTSVIDCKCKEWATDDKMVKYLRPQTLFSTNFEAYLQDANRLKNGNPAKPKWENVPV